MKKGLWVLALAVIGAVAYGIVSKSAVNDGKASQNGPSLKIDVVVDGLNHPWGLAFLSDGRFLISERPGTLWLFDPQGKKVALKGLPEIWVESQGGLLDVAVHQDWVYFSYSEPGPDNTSSTAVARAQLKGDELVNLEVIFSQKPKKQSHAHFGSRLVFSEDNALFVVLGDRKFFRDDAQTLDNHHGKVVRIDLDGGVPNDNPFTETPGALPEIWSLGHRNAQGAVLHPQTKALWVHEHGPKGGDELNIVEPGKNYGWPVITYGEEYRGGTIGEGTHKAGMAQPLHYWVPSIAPSGMAFYTGDQYPEWKGDLFIGSLKFLQLVRLRLDGNRVVEEERLLESELGERIRTVVQGPDQLLYLLTDEDNGKLVRILPFQHKESHANKKIQ